MHRPADRVPRSAGSEFSPIHGLRRRWISAIAVVGGVVLLVAAAVVIPWLLVSPENLTKVELLAARNAIRSTLLQAAAGLAVGSGAVIAWLKLQAEREAGMKQRELDREGQITERLTRAIDQLGSEKLQVRVGGIFALERIARDSARDQGAMVEVLTAFVREQAPRQSVPDAFSGDDPDVRPSTDVQAALTVLARRRPDNDPERLELHLNDCFLANAALFDAALEGAWLDRTNLAGSKLVQAHLSGACLISSHLEGAKLEGTELREANLRNADLRKADLHLACLEGADLAGARLEGAKLRYARLEGADLTGANLAGAQLPNDGLKRTTLARANLAGISIGHAHWPSICLVGATLDNATISEGDLTGALLTSASLVGARLRWVTLDGAKMNRATELEWQEYGGSGIPRATSLRGADLSGSTLRRADLSFADLREAVLDGTDLEDANLAGADLRGVDLSKALGLTERQFREGTPAWLNSPPIIDEQTKAPPFRPDDDDEH